MCQIDTQFAGNAAMAPVFVSVSGLSEQELPCVDRKCIECDGWDPDGNQTIDDSMCVVSW